MEPKQAENLPNIMLLKVPEALYNRTSELMQIPNTHTFGELQVLSNGKVSLLKL